MCRSLSVSHDNKSTLNCLSLNLASYLQHTHIYATDVHLQRIHPSGFPGFISPISQIPCNVIQTYAEIFVRVTGISMSLTNVRLSGTHTYNHLNLICVLFTSGIWGTHQVKCSDSRFSGRVKDICWYETKGVVLLSDITFGHIPAPTTLQKPLN